MGKLEIRTTHALSWSAMDAVAELWGEALAEGRLAQAYLLVGEGTRQIAHSFLLRLLCPDGGCRECAACGKILHENHPDVRWIERAGAKISIDQIRELQQDARYRPLEAPQKVYVLAGTETLSREASNSLLKLLEDPPPQIILLLLARHVSQLLPTILSRCQVLRVAAPNRARVHEVLESHGCGDEEIAYWHALVDGAPSRAAGVIAGSTAVAKVLERRDRVRRNVQDADIATLVEHLEGDDLVQAHEATRELLRRLPEQPAHEILDTAQALSKLDEDALVGFCHDALRWYRDLVLIGEFDDYLFNRDALDDLRSQRPSMTVAHIQECIQTLEETPGLLQANANARLALESLLFTLRG